MKRAGFLTYSLALLSITIVCAGCARTVTPLQAVPQVEKGDQAEADVGVVVPHGPSTQRWDRIVTWGDSLTHGNQDSSGIRYPSQVASLLGVHVLNAGVGGQSSSQIAVRGNAYEGYHQQTFADSFLIPTSGSVTVTFQQGYEPCWNAPINSLGTMYGKQGIPIRFTVGSNTYEGTCSDNLAHVLSFTPDSYPQNPVLVPAGTGWAAVIDGLDKACWLIWSGRTDKRLDPDLTLANIAAMVAKAKVGSGCYLVLGILNAANEPEGSTLYNDIVALNRRLAATYGVNFLDVRTFFVDQQTAGAPPDVYFRAQDISPYSLRAQHFSGKLLSAISNSTCSLSFGQTLEPGTTVTISSELIQVQQGTDGNYTCIRGFGSTEAVAHNSGAYWTGVDPLHPGQNTSSTRNGYAVVAQAVADKLRRMQPLAGGPGGHLQ